MPALGRNDPCHCGSGRKYKRCCLGAAALEHPAAYSSEERTSAFTKLLRFCRRPEFDADRRLALDLFWSDRLERLPEPEASEIRREETLLQAFLIWLAFDFDLSDGPDLTVAGRYLRTKSADLSAGERTWLTRMAASSLRLFEVTHVRLDLGLGLRDLRNGEQLDVTERMATRQLRQWDVLAVRVIEGPAGTFVLEGDPYSFPREVTPTLVATIGERERIFSRALGADPGALFEKHMGALLHKLWLDLAVHRPLPTVVTAEGDALVFSKVVFDVDDEALVRDRLAHHPSLEATDEGFTWFEPTKDMPRLLGSVTLQPNRLTLDTQSVERAERGRRLLEQTLGGAIRYRITSTQSVEQALADVRDRTPERRGRSEIPAGVEQQVVGEFLMGHYRDWLDAPIPALGGRTPRHGARLKTIRPKVIELIKGIENQMAHERAEGRPAIEVDWLWTALDLPKGDATGRLAADPPAGGVAGR